MCPLADVDDIIMYLGTRRSEFGITDNEWEQLGIYFEAFRLFMEREAKYRSLWKRYGAADSYQHMNSKMARSQFLLEGLTDDQDDPLDLINYTVFFLRNLRAGRLTNTVDRREVPENWLLLLKDEELVDLHHAARMMRMYPSISEELRQRYQGIADSLWGEFVRRREDAGDVKPPMPPENPSNIG